MKLNLGAGSTLRLGFMNIDIRPLPGVDIVRDVLRGIPFSNESVDEVYSENFLEHIPQTECIWIMNEIHRVLCPGGTARHLVPLAGSTNFFQDPTHLSHWVPETLTYFQLDHRRNLYYGGDIRPWMLESYELLEPNKVMDFTLRKPH